MHVIVTDRPIGAGTAPADAVLKHVDREVPSAACAAPGGFQVSRRWRGHRGGIYRLAALATMRTCAITEEKPVIAALGLGDSAYERGDCGRSRRRRALAWGEACWGRAGCFQMATRLTAGGRLKKASLCVELLTTRKRQRPGTGGGIEPRDAMRQERRRRSFSLALRRWRRKTSYFRRVLIGGRGLNSGCIGLADGRLTSGSTPAIVLSQTAGRRGQRALHPRGQYLRNALYLPGPVFAFRRP
jgi:hypothetical protein